MTWLLLTADMSVLHWHRSPTVLESSGEMPSRCCIAVQYSASFGSNAGTMGRTLSHAADA
jgi:hypothetical protein